jgi:hypothetical protein
MFVTFCGNVRIIIITNTDKDMAKEIDIEKVLYPKKDILVTDKEGTITATIVDAEIDAIKCTFNYDGCVQLDTDEYAFITLSVDNLYKLIQLIEKAEKKYDKQFKKEGL